VLTVGCWDTCVDIGVDEGGEDVLGRLVVAWFGEVWEDVKVETWLWSLTDINGGDVGV
jgi:hypothetical protein